MFECYSTRCFNVIQRDILKCDRLHDLVRRIFKSEEKTKRSNKYNKMPIKLKKSNQEMFRDIEVTWEGEICVYSMLKEKILLFSHLSP